MNSPILTVSAVPSPAEVCPGHDTTGITTTGNEWSRGVELSEELCGPSDLSNLRLLAMHACKQSTTEKRKITCQVPCAHISGSATVGAGLLETLSNISDIIDMFRDDWSAMSILRWRIKASLLTYMESRPCCCVYERVEKSTNRHKRRRVCSHQGASESEARTASWCNSCAECVKWIERMIRSFQESHASVTTLAYMRSRKILVEFLLAVAMCMRPMGRPELVHYGCICCIYLMRVPWLDFPVLPLLVVPISLTLTTLSARIMSTGLLRQYDAMPDLAPTALQVQLFSYQDIHTLYACLREVPATGSSTLEMRTRVTDFLKGKRLERPISVHKGTRTSSKKLETSANSKWENKFLIKLHNTFFCVA